MDDDTAFPAASGPHHQRGTVAGRLSGELPVAPLPRSPTTGSGGAREPRSGAAHGSTRHPRASAPNRTRVDLTVTDNVNSSRPQHADIPEQRRNSESEPPTEPAPSGLEVFDLGSVPASVTPPRTWRRAAWFATVSSGSVVGLLFAGAFLLGHQPEQDQTSGDGTYLDHNHNAALIERGRQSTAQQPTPGEAPNSDRATGSTTATSAVAQPHDPSARANTAGAPSATPSANPSTTQDPDGTGAANRPIRATAGDSPSSSTEQPPETVVSPQHSVMPQRAVTDREPQ